MRMTLNDIGKVSWRVLSAIIRTASGTILCVGGLAVDIAGKTLLGVSNSIFSILTATLSIVATTASSTWLLTL